MDTLFFLASKILWALARVDTLLLLGFAIGTLALWRRRERMARRWLGATLVIAVLLSFVPLGHALLQPLEQRYPPDPELPKEIAGILVLGGGEDPKAVDTWRRPQTNEAGERYIEAKILADRFPQAPVLFTGGSGALNPAETNEAQMSADLLIAMGLAPDRLILEGKSRNTAENAALSLSLRPDSSAPWVLVTSAFHMPRALATFCSAGWSNLVPWPVDQRTRAVTHAISWEPAAKLGWLNLASREWIGLVAYRWTGRIDPNATDGCLHMPG